MSQLPLPCPATATTVPRPLCQPVPGSSNMWADPRSAAMRRACFTQHVSLQIHPCCSMYHDFLQIEGEQCPTACIRRMLLAVTCRRTLGRLHLALVRDAAVNMGVPLPSGSCFPFFGYVLRNRLAGSYNDSVFNIFEEPPNFSSTVVYIPTNRAQSFSFSTSSPTRVPRCWKAATAV